MQSTNVQSTTGNLPVGKRHYGQRTSWQRPIGLNTTGKWMLGKMLRGQYDWQANYDRPNFRLQLLKLNFAKNTTRFIVKCRCRGRLRSINVIIIVMQLKKHLRFAKPYHR